MTADRCAMSNPYVKSLKPFDPKKDLLVNEKFRIEGSQSQPDTLSDLEAEEGEAGLSGDAGKEYCSFKTGGPILGSIRLIPNTMNRTILLAGNKNGEVYLLTPEGSTLKPIIKFKIPGSIIRTPAYADGIIYCTTREGLVIAVNTGLKDATDNTKALQPEVIWQEKMPKGILTEPIATGKILIIASLGGLRAYEAYYESATAKAIGKSLWVIPIDGTVSTPLLHSGVIYIGSEDKHLYAFEYGGRSASPVWHYKANAAIRAKPTVSKRGNYILASSIDGSVYCLPSTGEKLRWVFIARAPIYSSIVSTIIDNEEFFYFGADNGIFYCLNTFGKEVWRFKTNGKIRTEPLIHENAIFFGCEDNHLYCLNIKTGKPNFTFSTDGNINGSPIIVDNILYFGSTDSFIHGIHL
jgi:outer membrane protein assembly factor BamB